MEPASLSTGPQYFTLLPTIKLGPSGAGSRVGGLVHTIGPSGSLQRPLLWGWESLLLPLQPPRVFSIRGLRLYFPGLEPWVARSALFPAVCPVYLWANVGPRDLLVVRQPAPYVPHSASLGPATAMRILSTPVPVSAPPTRLDECLFFISLVLDFLAIWFSVSSGCARRRSVSTYAAILVLSSDCNLLIKFYYTIILSTPKMHVNIYISKYQILSPIISFST